MKGDTIVVEAHHRRAAEEVAAILLPSLEGSSDRYSVSVAGESGGGKSEIAVALAEQLASHDVPSVILQQDDYFVYPPRSNDKARREDIAWVGPQEVRLDLLDAHIEAFLDGASEVDKPLVIYEDDSISNEVIEFGPARVVIAEGTYTTLLDNVRCHVFIDRSFEQTRAHREKRHRDDSELDPFIDRVLAIEHDIIAANKARAQIVIDDDYNAAAAG